MLYRGKSWLMSMVLLVISGLLVSGCGLTRMFNGSGQGSLNVGITMGSKALTDAKGEPMEMAVRLSKGALELRFTAPFTDGGSALNVPKLDTGKWDVEVTVAYSSGITIYSGTSQVDVAAGSPTSLTVPISPIKYKNLVLIPFSYESKSGTTDVTISWSGSVGTKSLSVQGLPPIGDMTPQHALDMAMRQGENTMLRLPSSSEDGGTVKGLNTMPSQRAFWVTGYAGGDPGQWKSVNATLKGEGGHCAIYVDNTCTTLPDSVVRTLVDAFDSKYQIMTTTFGSEPNPGVDKDPRVVILFTPLNGGAYFSSANQYKQSELDRSYGKGTYYSNECEMIYITAPSGIPTETGINWASATLIHEFQHMINFNQHQVRGTGASETWLNEGLSVLAEDVVGYGYHTGSNTGILAAYLQAPQNGSPLYWTYLNEDYGASYLLMRWFIDKYGLDRIKDLEYASDGISALEQVSGLPIKKVMSDFGTAVYLDGLNGSDTINSLNLRGTQANGVGLSGPATNDCAYPGPTKSVMKYGSLQFFKVPKWTFGDYGYALTGSNPNDKLGIAGIKY